MIGLLRHLVTPMVFATLILAAPRLGMAVDSPGDSPIETTVCSIARKPELFDGQVVRFRAIAKTNMHSTMLYSDSGDYAISLLIPESSIQENTDVDRLLGESFGPKVAAGERRVQATFVGKIDWRPGEVPALVLLLIGLENLVVEETKRPKN